VPFQRRKIELYEQMLADATTSYGQRAKVGAELAEARRQLAEQTDDDS